jgi:hypothetical protein
LEIGGDFELARWITADIELAGFHRERIRTVPIFRDLEGNIYDLPADLLAKHRVEGEVSEGTKLHGAEVEAGPAAAPRYFWPPNMLHAQGTELNGQQAPQYFWETPREPRAPQYFWDTPRPAQYFWDPPSGAPRAAVDPRLARPGPAAATTKQDAPKLVTEQTAKQAKPGRRRKTK